MNSSEKAMISAPSRAACMRARRAFSPLPAMSPTLGLDWAIAIARRSAGREFMPLDVTIVHARGNRRRVSSDQPNTLGERQKPDQPGHEQGKPDGGRAHVLHLA